MSLFHTIAGAIRRTTADGTVPAITRVVGGLGELEAIAVAKSDLIDSLRDQVNGLTGEIEAAEKTLRQSRANDREAMSWIADCKEATGYHGSLMPSFVEYLRDLKQRADK